MTWLVPEQAMCDGGRPMAQGPAASLAPYLFYQDVAGAARFLQEAFGFTLGFTSPDPGGGLAHAQLLHGSGLIMDPEGQFWMFARRLATG
jgi:uncharacterized glyoxalase superfamily protein PhnB